MIHILVGTDIRKRAEYLKSLSKGRDVLRFPPSGISRESILEYAGTANLFGDSPVIIADNIIREDAIALSVKDLAVLEASATSFIFLEDSLKAADEKKYKKYGIVERFEEKKIAQAPKANPFAIVDAFARRDKIAAWILYRDAVEKGAEPESISGLLFWKIKSMILSKNRVFTADELKHHSSSIVSLYHHAHRGERDFIIGLEQFILSALSK